MKCLVYSKLSGAYVACIGCRACLADDRVPCISAEGMHDTLPGQSHPATSVNAIQT